MNKQNRFLNFECNTINVFDRNHILLTDVKLVGKRYDWGYVSLHFHANNDATVKFYHNEAAFKLRYYSLSVQLSQLRHRPCPMI